MTESGAFGAIYALLLSILYYRSLPTLHQVPAKLPDALVTISDETAIILLTKVIPLWLGMILAMAARAYSGTT